MTCEDYEEFDYCNYNCDKTLDKIMVAGGEMIMNGNAIVEKIFRFIFYFIFYFIYYWCFYVIPYVYIIFAINYNQPIFAVKTFMIHKIILKILIYIKNFKYLN